MQLIPSAPTPPTPPTLRPFPAPAPVPVLPLAYAQTHAETNVRRPAGLLAIGIISLLMGLLTALANGFLVAVLCRGYANSIPPAPPPALPPIPAANVVPHAGDYVRTAGLTADDRKIVLEAVNARLKLPPDRAILLDRFLADIGRDAFGDPPFSSTELAGRIAEAGQEAKGRDGDGALGTHYIVTARGRITLDNSFAVFAANGSGNMVALDGNIIEGVDPYEKRWCAAALNEWIEALHARDARQMSAQQAAVLLGYAEKLPAKMPRDFRDEFGFVVVEARKLNVEGYMGQVLTARFDGHDVYLLPDGRIADRNIYRWGLGPAPSFTPNPPPAPRFTPALPGSLEALEFVIAESGAQAALGVLLVIAGLMLVLDRPSAAHWQALWAVLQVVLSTGSVAVTFWYASTVPATLRPALVATPRLVGWITFALAYPVVVFFVLRSRAVSRYYGWDRNTLDDGNMPRSFKSRLARRAASPFGAAAVMAGALLAAFATIGNLAAIGIHFIYGESPTLTRIAPFAAGLLVAAFILKQCIDVRALARRGSGGVQPDADQLETQGALA